MLNRLAVHVADVEGAIGTIGEKYRAEPIVAAGEKFTAGSGGARGKSRAERSKNIAVHEVPSRIAREDVTVVIGGQRSAAIDQYTASGGEGAGVGIGGGDVLADR